MIESGVSPMFMLIVAGFYKKHEQALRMGVWYAASKLLLDRVRKAVLTWVGFSWICVRCLSFDQLRAGPHHWWHSATMAIQYESPLLNDQNRRY